MFLFDEWSSLFRANLEGLFRHSAIEEINHFWPLFVGGESVGKGTWFWISNFRNWYVLHLLILSGSQVESLCRLIRCLYALGLKILNIETLTQGRWHSGLLRGVLTCFVLGFALATEWSPPITRASIVSILGIWFFRLGSLNRLVLGLFLHVLFFADHLAELGFYLSWVAFSMIFVMGHSRRFKYISGMVVSGLMFFILEIGLLEKSFSLENFFVCLVSNLVLGVVFDTIFMPIAAVMIFACLVLSFLSLLGIEGLAEVIGNFLALWTTPIAYSLLVVLKTLMYN